MVMRKSEKEIKQFMAEYLILCRKHGLTFATHDHPRNSAHADGHSHLVRFDKDDQLYFSFDNHNYFGDHDEHSNWMLDAPYGHCIKQPDIDKRYKNVFCFEDKLLT